MNLGGLGGLLTGGAGGKALEALPGILQMGLGAIDYFINSGSANQANLSRYYSGLDELANLRKRQLGNWKGGGNVPTSELPSVNSQELNPTLTNIGSRAATMVPPMLDPLGLARMFGAAADNFGNRYAQRNAPPVIGDKTASRIRGRR